MTSITYPNLYFSPTVKADWIKTSISISTLEQRISRLGQYINEAQWRHQLVSTCCNGDEFEDDMPEETNTAYSSDGDGDLDQGMVRYRIVSYRIVWYCMVLF